MKRGVIYGLVLVGLLVALRSGCDRRIDNQISSPVLRTDEQAKVILDPRRHTVTTVERSKVDGSIHRRSGYLPPHVTSVTVDKDGAIKVGYRAAGTECAPFVGFAYSDQARVVLGLNLLYYHQWEGGLGIAPTMSGPFSVRLALLASYNVYSNTSLFLGITHQKEPIGGISFKF